MITVGRAREIIRWKGLLSTAENTYPQPAGFTVEEVASGRPLNKLKVSHLTKAFIEHSQAHHKYEAAWEEALGEEVLPWQLVTQTRGDAPSGSITQRHETPRCGYLLHDSPCTRATHMDGKIRRHPAAFAERA